MGHRFCGFIRRDGSSAPRKNKRREDQDFLFKCEKNHDKRNFVYGQGRRTVPYCKKCRTTTPDGNTIINFGNLIYK